MSGLTMGGLCIGVLRRPCCGLVVTSYRGAPLPVFFLEIELLCLIYAVSLARASHSPRLPSGFLAEISLWLKKPLLQG